MMVRTPPFFSSLSLSSQGKAMMVCVHSSFPLILFPPPQDLAMMVHTQGKSIDRIEEHMFEASTRTTQALEQMQEARVSAQSARKKKYILLAVVSSVVIIILIALIAQFSSSK